MEPAAARAPAALVVAYWTCTSAPPALCPNASGAGDIDEFTTQPLPNGAMLQYSLIATLSSGASGFVTNTVTAINTGIGVSEIDPANNSATDTDAVIGDGLFRNGLALWGVDVLWQEFTVGLLIIVAVAIDQWIRKVSA